MLAGLEPFREGMLEKLVAVMSIDYTAFVPWSWCGNAFVGSAWGLGVLGRLGKIWGVLMFWRKSTVNRGKKTKTGGSNKKGTIYDSGVILY